MNGQEPARRVPVETALHGLRLDRAVMTLCGLSLRAARRRIEDGGILLDGRPAAAALRLRAGQTLELLPDDHICRGHAGDEAALAVRLLGRQGDYAAFVKPAGLHSSPLAGRCAPNLEDAARTLWGDEARPLHFLQRLDQATSGIVCAALSPDAAQRFRTDESRGRYAKAYLALLHGELNTPVTADRALDVDSRSVSRVLDKAAPPLRHTLFFPLQVLRGDEAEEVLAANGLPAVPAATITLAACLIRCGARHQIRAHAASLGLPLCGDSRYAPSGGSPAAGGPERFLLHHARLSGPCGQWLCLPDWNGLPFLENHFRKWLESLSRYDSIFLTEKAAAARAPARERG